MNRYNGGGFEHAYARLLEAGYIRKVVPLYSGIAALALTGSGLRRYLNDPGTRPVIAVEAQPQISASVVSAG